MKLLRWKIFTDGADTARVLENFLTTWMGGQRVFARSFNRYILKYMCRVRCKFKKKRACLVNGRVESGFVTEVFDFQILRLKSKSVCKMEYFCKIMKKINVEIFSNLNIKQFVYSRHVLQKLRSNALFIILFKIRF